MENPFSQIPASSLLLFLLTPFVYWLAIRINKLAAGHQLFHPLITSVFMVIVVLIALDKTYPEYSEANQLFDWLLGPAVVSLAIPLYENLSAIKRWLFPTIVTICTIVFLSPVLIGMIGEMIELDTATKTALSTKTVTTPIALSINALLNGNPSLAAALVMITGIIGATIGPPLLKMLKITDPQITGIALGVTSHAIGTQRAFDISTTCGAFAAFTMILTGVIASLLLPYFSLIFTF